MKYGCWVKYCASLIDRQRAVEVSDQWSRARMHSHKRAHAPYMDKLSSYTCCLTHRFLHTSPVMSDQTWTSSWRAYFITIIHKNSLISYRYRLLFHCTCNITDRVNYFAISFGTWTMHQMSYPSDIFIHHGSWTFIRFHGGIKWRWIVF